MNSKILIKISKLHSTRTLSAMHMSETIFTVSSIKTIAKKVLSLQ
jgi:hypothetical protein